MTYLLVLLAGLFGAATCSPVRSHPEPTAVVACTDPIRGDVDGDGKTDDVTHAYEGDGAVVRLCTADGERLTAPGLGMGEDLLLLDVDGDGALEVLPGGTSASGGGYDVLRYDRGRLVRLDLHLLTEMNAIETAAWGCDGGHVVQATVDWRTRVARLETFTVAGTRVTRTATTRQVPDGADRTTYANSLVTPCRGAVTR